MTVVDILIPFYNAKDSLSAALCSVETQTCKSWHVILINDGSTDGSGDIAENFLRCHPGQCTLVGSLWPRSGAAVSRNEGLRAARGTYIMCLDADDKLEPYCLEQRLLVMQQNPQLHWAVFNQYQVAPAAKQPYPLFNKPVKTREAAISFFLQMLPAWQTMAPLWQTAVLRKFGGFDSLLYPMEDLDLHLRALLDTNFNIAIKFDLPADCYYFVANKSDEKLEHFYHNDIRAKFLYLKKTVAYLPYVVGKSTLELHKKFVRKGFLLFLSTTLLSRLGGYTKEIEESIYLLKENKIISAIDSFKIRFIIRLYTCRSTIVVKMKLRGIVHSLFLSKLIYKQ